MILPGHSMEEIREKLEGIFADPKISVKYVDNSYNVFDRAPDTKAFAPILPSAEVMQPLERVTDAMWPSAPVIPKWRLARRTASTQLRRASRAMAFPESRWIRTMCGRAGKDEPVRISSFYDGVEFYYRYLKALTGVH